MKNLYNSEAKEEIISRIEQLNHESVAKWGKMNVAQMMSHCAGGMKMAAGEIDLPRIFMGRIIGPLVKKGYYDDSKTPKGLMTAKALKMTDEKDFEKEKIELLKWIDIFCNAGPESCTKTPHPFLGKFTPEQWAKGMYKHLNHHQEQFAV
jgi:hypothetical protein